MKKVAKLVVLCMALFPIAFLTGCARRCCETPCAPKCGPVMQQECCTK